MKALMCSSVYTAADDPNLHCAKAFKQAGQCATKTSLTSPQGH